MATMEEYFKKSSTRDLLRRKLQEVISEGTQVCDNLVDYICLLCMNKMTDNEHDAKKTFQEDLNAFFGDKNSEIFTTWIWKHMRRFREASQEVIQADFPSVKHEPQKRRERREKVRKRRKRSRSESYQRDRGRKHARKASPSGEKSIRGERVLPQKKRASPKKRERNLFTTVLKEIQAGTRSSKLTSYGSRVKPPDEPPRISDKGTFTVKRPGMKSNKSKRKLLLEPRNRARERKVTLDSNDEESNSAFEEHVVEEEEKPIKRDNISPSVQIKSDRVTVKEEEEKLEVDPLKPEPEFVISFSGQASSQNKKHKRRFITDESVGKQLAKQETNAALVIEHPELLTGPDSTICWDYFSIVGCQRPQCKWRHELPANGNVKLEVIDMNLLQPVLKYSEMLKKRVGWQRGRGSRGRSWPRANGIGRGWGRGARTYPNITWTAEGENSVLKSEGDVQTNCFFDPDCERIGCHFQHPKRKTKTKKFLESSTES